MKNVIDFFIAVYFLLFQFLGFAVGFLQHLQLEPYTTNTSFISLFIGELGLKGTLEMSELWQSVDTANEALVLGQEAWNDIVET